MPLTLYPCRVNFPCVVFASVSGIHRPPLAQQDRAGDTDVAGAGFEAPVAVHFGFPACDEGITWSGRRVLSHECGYADPDVKSPDDCMLRTQPNAFL